MLGNAAPTPFDLHFVVFRIPVRVHPLFWLLSAFMGWNPEVPQETVIWVVCVFVSVLVHELGHALTAQHYGWPPEIVLYSFGGYASFHPGWGYTTRRAIQILLSGPVAGFVLFGLVYGAQYILGRRELPPRCEDAIEFLKYINLWWGVMNLLPVYPLDGGQIARHLLSHWRPYDGVQMSLKLSLLTAGGLAAYFLTRHQNYTGILFALLAVESFQALRGTTQ